jgi:hypothetical protein
MPSVRVTVVRDRNTVEPDWTNPIILGTTKPIGGVNIGAGIYEERDYPTATAPTGGGITYNSTNKEWTVSAGVTLENRVFPGFVNLGDGARLINCPITGPDAEVTNMRALVQGPSTTGQAYLDWCTIDPDIPSAYYDGIGRGLWVTYTDVKNVVDGIRAFSTSANGVRIRAEAVHIHSMTQFAPDYAYNGGAGRAETHNDGIQCQGNPNGDDTDIYLDGCWIDARHSTTKGDTPPYREQIAAIMITPQSSQGAVHMTYTRGWLSGGVYCVNAGSDTVDDYGPSSLVLTGTRFERPGTNVYGDGRAPDVALALDANLIRTLSGNTYEDNGAAVPVTNA